MLFKKAMQRATLVFIVVAVLCLVMGFLLLLYFGRLMP